METNEYKIEQAWQIQIISQDNLSYWFERYEEKRERIYCCIHAQETALFRRRNLGGSVGAAGGIRRTGGGGYRGASLKRFEMDILSDSTTISFVYNDIDRIVD